MLNRKIALYVPGTTDVNVPAPEQQAAAVVHALEQFAEWFGGATVIDGQGAWMSDEHGLVVEPVRIVYCFTDAEGLAKHLSEVKLLARHVCRAMSQECVSLEVAGELQFIEVAEVADEKVA